MAGTTGRVRKTREEFASGGGVATQERPAETEPTKRLSGDIRPADLRDYDGPLYVKNNTRNVISHDDGKGNVFRLNPMGTEDSLLPFPLAVALHHGIQKLWRQGKIIVSTDPDLEEQLAIDRDETDRGGVLEYTFGDEQSAEMTVFQCLIGGEQVLLTKEEQESGVPPLCEDHVDRVGNLEQYEEGGKLLWRLKK